MTKEALKEILSSRSERFTIAEIRDMLDEELDKPSDEMDTDFVEELLSALEAVYENWLYQIQRIKWRN